MVNAQIRQFRNNIIASLNSENIPMEIKRLVLVEILKSVEDEANKEIQRELIESQKGDLEDGQEQCKG